MKKQTKRVYVVRRILAAILLAIGLSAGAVIVHEMYEDLTSPSYECEDITVVVKEGDTIWSIGESHCEGDLLDVRYQLTRTYGTDIWPGQRIELP